MKIYFFSGPCKTRNCLHVIDFLQYMNRVIFIDAFFISLIIVRSIHTVIIVGPLQAFIPKVFK